MVSQTFKMYVITILVLIILRKVIKLFDELVITLYIIDTDVFNSANLRTRKSNGTTILLCATTKLILARSHENPRDHQFIKSICGFR